MNSTALKIIAYPLIFILSFALFLYWVFPYEILKDRITGMIEQQVGGGLEVNIGELEPYWFTGVDISGLSIGEPGEAKLKALVDLKRVRARASLVSLLFGRPNISFVVEVGKGEISGRFQQSDDFLSIDADIDSVDLGNFKMISAGTGLQISSNIDGEISLRIDKQNSVQSSGTVSLEFGELKSAAGEAKLGEVSLPLPELAFSSSRDSQIRLDIGKGVISVENFKLAGGDLGVDLKGKVFLSPKAENYRFNLNGTFTASQKLGQALPFLFIVEQQKQSDGSYPLNITGRLAKPSIKVGTFTVPL